MSTFWLTRNGRWGLVPSGELKPGDKALLFVLCVGLTGLTAVVNGLIGVEVSFSIFYLIPISLGAWRAGFSPGVFLGLFATGLWHVTDLLESTSPHPAIQVWNGVVRFCVFVLLTCLLCRLRTALRQEQYLSRTDALTGVANARTFYELAAQEIERVRRTPRPFTVVYLDVDDFKSINDRLGHCAGDALLRQVARSLERESRASDLIARLGGDEFALFLPETDATGAAAFLDKMRHTVTQETSENGWPITCSIGAATFFSPPREVESMIQRVDGLMYSVKQNGKNHIRHEIIREMDGVCSSSPLKVDRRASIRLLCELDARVQLEGRTSDRELIGRIRNISPRGIGLHIDVSIEIGTILTLEVLGRTGQRLLLARVVRRARQGSGWVHGCDLAHRLRQAGDLDWVSEEARMSSVTNSRAC